jgi:hypothetical protein
MSSTPSRFGSVNNGADGSFANDYALFLKVWSGEVLGQFGEHNRMMPLHTVKTIESGKTAQFIVTGKATASYHVAGTQLLGSNGIPSNEKNINIDNPLIADVSVADVDAAIAHFDVRSDYTKLLARSLAKKADQQLLRVGVLAARASATVTGGNAGSVIDAGATVVTSSDVLYDAIFDAQVKMNEKDVPEEDRFVILSPANYGLLSRSTKVHDKDWGGSGNIADGTAPRLAGFSILWSNNLPTGVVAAETGTNNTYSGTFTNTVALCFQREAIGTVKLRDLSMESQRRADFQDNLLIAKYMMGHGILRPECAVEITKA